MTFIITSVLYLALAVSYLTSSYFALFMIAAFYAGIAGATISSWWR